ncbi:MAG: NADH-quinone oxidoreductase subunit NuoH [Bradymonadales bacterium]|nr:NADH-quinone oxidoreductase subunit NuoH [Bradymonadales bacterium]
MSIWIILLKVVVIAFLFVMTLGALFTLVERKQSALIQNRMGPNRANIGPFRLGGVFHIIADAIKSLLKEDIVPDSAHRRLHFWAPIIALIPPLIVIGVVPFADTWCSGTVVVDLALGAQQHGVEQCMAGPERLLFQIADIDAGFLFIFAISSLGVYGVALAGWSSNNKYGLLGGLRASAQMVSYEVSMLLALAGIVMIYGSIDLNDIVREQGELVFGFLPKWGILVQPVAFFLFFTAAIAETKRAPFDMPEADSELVAGYFTEYSGMKFASFMFAEFMEVVVLGTVMATVFLGGWQLPFLYADGFHFGGGGPHLALPYGLVVVIRIATFIGKVLFLCWLQLQIRWTYPRFRYDQIMTLGWKVLLPLSLANLAVTGIVLQWF